jgi:hypothetical protein
LGLSLVRQVVRSEWYVICPVMVVGGGRAPLFCRPLGGGADYATLRRFCSWLCGDPSW